MTNEKALNWLIPTVKTRGGSWRSKFPELHISAKPFKTGKDLKTGAHWRVIMNGKFLEKYYDGIKEGGIAIAIGGQGVLFDPKPKSKQPHFKFNKANTISDQGLVEAILKHFEIAISETEQTRLKLHSKPFGLIDDKSIYQLVLIDSENDQVSNFEKTPAAVNS